MKKDMITLGIETSCDETGIAVLKGNKILSNVVASSMHLHEKFGGVVPEIASRYHVEVINYVFKEALKKAEIGTKDIDLISVTQGPGLIGALLIGISFAKALSLSLDVPIIGTNHIISHLWANYLSSKPKLPFMGLAISGGHTSLIYVKGANKYQVIGQTTDDAVGEAFDKVAKILGLGYPGGPQIQKAAQGVAPKDMVPFQVSSNNDKSLDFSFSGIKTSVLYYAKKAGGAEGLNGNQVARIAAGFERASCEEIVKKTMLACRLKKTGTLVVGGGVSANLSLRSMLAREAALNNIDLFVPPFNLCLDNGAMIAALGSELFKNGIKSDLYISGFTNFN